MIVVFLETFLEIICVFHRVATFFKPQPCRNQLPEFGVTLLMQEVNFLETTSISSACTIQSHAGYGFGCCIFFPPKKNCYLGFSPVEPGGLRINNISSYPRRLAAPSSPLGGSPQMSIPIGFTQSNLLSRESTKPLGLGIRHSKVHVARRIPSTDF